MSSTVALPTIDGVVLGTTSTTAPEARNSASSPAAVPLGQRLLDLVPDAIASVTSSPCGVIVECNRACHALFAEQSAIGKNLLDALGETSAHLLQELIMSPPVTHRPYEVNIMLNSTLLGSTVAFAVVAPIDATHVLVRIRQPPPPDPFTVIMSPHVQHSTLPPPQKPSVSPKTPAAPTSFARPGRIMKAAEALNLTEESPQPRTDNPLSEPVTVLDRGKIGDGDSVEAAPRRLSDADSLTDAEVTDAEAPVDDPSMSNTGNPHAAPTTEDGVPRDQSPARRPVSAPRFAESHARKTSAKREGREGTMRVPKWTATNEGIVVRLNHSAQRLVDLGVLPALVGHSWLEGLGRRNAGLWRYKAEHADSHNACAFCLRWNPGPRERSAAAAGGAPTRQWESGAMIIVWRVASDDGGDMLCHLIPLSARRASDDLASASDALAAAAQPRSPKPERQLRFVATVCHELRNPLHGIMGTLELMEEMCRASTDPLPRDEIQDRLVDLRECTHFLKRVVDEVLDISKLHAQRVELVLEPMQPRALFQSVVMMFRGKIMQKELDVSTLFEGVDEDSWIIADEMRLKQVVTNLVSNSIKFTEQRGQILLKMEMSEMKSDESSRMAQLAISVIDNGSGMSRESLRGLFKPFSGDAAAQRLQGGTGLGLSICASLVELMEGRLFAASEPGQGSTFVANVPVCVSSRTDPAVQAFLNESKRAPRPQPLAEPVLVGCSRLVDEDAARTAPTIRRRPSSGGSGTSSPNQAQPTQDDAERSRSRSRSLQEVPLLDAPTQVSTQPSTPRTLPHMFGILVVEDSMMNAKLLNRFLGGAGYRIYWARDGVEAIEALCHSWSVEVPFEVGEFGPISPRREDVPPTMNEVLPWYGLVLMDLGMPRLSGRDAVERIRAVQRGLPSAEQLPIVCLTGEEEVAPHELVGFDACVHKPYSQSDVLSVVQTYHRQHDQRFA